MSAGADYAWKHPSPAALKAAGIEFVMRYLSTDSSKNLTLAEARALAAAGIWSGVVWESTASRALAGRAAGAADAKTAAAQAAGCGQPADRPIYFAVDFAATTAQMAAVGTYFAGAGSVLGADRVGVYGGYPVVKWLLDHGLAHWAWQTRAWSDGRWDGRAHIRQGAYVSVGGVQCDANTSMTSDFGQWMPGISPAEDDVALTQDDIDKVAAAVTAKLTAGGGVLEGTDITRIWGTDGCVPAARPPYNNADYYGPDGKTVANDRWAAGYGVQTAVEGVRQAVALLEEIKTTLAGLGAGGLADQLAQQLGELEITVTKKESTA